jgi:hypothetical protein
MLVVLIACSFPVFSYDFPVEAPPPWLRVGTYVEYDCITWTYDGGHHEKPFVFRWECIALKSLVATLNITVDKLQAGKISVKVDVITNTRELLNANGTVLGKTFLWLPSNLKVGDKVVVNGKPPHEVVSEVQESGGASSLTCQGYQEIYCVDTVNYTYGLASVDGNFDLDTGILITGLSLDYTTTLSCLGLTELGWIKFLKATNVDLGPRYLRTEILTFLWINLPIIVPSIVFISAVAIIVRKRRKKRNLKQIKTS